MEYALYNEQFKKFYEKFSKKERLFLAALLIFLLMLMVIGSNNPFTVDRVCAESAQMDEELLDMIGFHDSELKSGAYVPKSRQREMAYEENKKREITEIYRGLCARAIETERKQLEIERANLEYNELIKRFDLQKIYGLPDDDRRRIFEAARVPVDGPHSKSDRMNLLQFYKKYPYQYR